MNGILDSGVQGWVPKKWSEIIGNHALKEHLLGTAMTIRTAFEPTGRVPPVAKQSLMAIGPSRGGKTASIKLAIRTLTCNALDEDFNPCPGTCESCASRVDITGQEGLFSVLGSDSRKIRIDFRVADCTMLYEPRQLEAILDPRQLWQSDLRITYFDEVHRLAKRSMDQMLLKAMEDQPAMFIFSTAYPENLEKMFLNRVLKFSTELPDAEELEDWLLDRCEEFEIPFEPAAIIRTAEKANRIAGIAIQALALAQARPDGLTMKLVEKGWVIDIESL